MKGKLIKRSNGRFDLYAIEDINQVNTIASSFDNPKGKLSVKNCEAISNGYDLDELAYEKSWNEDSEKGFINGAKAILEILDDKKFSISDMEKLMFATIEFTEQEEGETYPFLKNYIQSLQQAEWDVELVYQRACCSDNHTCGDEDNCMICTQTYPKLDADGCLILKRI
jgi:hypothetical protein